MIRKMQRKCLSKKKTKRLVIFKISFLKTDNNSKMPKTTFYQWRSQNAEKNTHHGRLLYQAMILYHYVPFQNGNSIKGKKICCQRERFLSSKSSSLRYGNNFYHIRRAPLSVTIFITHVRILRNWSYANVYSSLFILFSGNMYIPVNIYVS